MLPIYPDSRRYAFLTIDTSEGNNPTHPTFCQEVDGWHDATLETCCAEKHTRNTHTASQVNAHHSSKQLISTPQDTQTTHGISFISIFVNQTPCFQMSPSAPGNTCSVAAGDESVVVKKQFLPPLLTPWCVVYALIRPDLKVKKNTLAEGEFAFKLWGKIGRTYINLIRARWLTSTLPLVCVTKKERTQNIDCAELSSMEIIWIHEGFLVGT